MQRQDLHRPLVDASLSMTLAPKFRASTSSFPAELRRQVNAYFVAHGKAKTGDSSLYVKAAILWGSFVALYIVLVFFTPANGLALLGCAALGVLTAAIGFNVMHDGAHNSFSGKRWLNGLAGLSLNALGADVSIWKTKHNVVHHTYTNIGGVDDDLNARPLLRLCQTQAHYAIHRYQHLYFWAVYSLLYLVWVFGSDYMGYFTKKVGGMPLRAMARQDHLAFWGAKGFHALVFMALPIATVGVVPWLFGFLVYGMATSVVLSLVFQLAHAVEDAQFPVARQPAHEIDSEWTLHQLQTTANFATQNPVITWLLGGLNFQIEHHLFPAISHVHYPAMSKIVKKLCQDHGLDYLEYPTLQAAVASHVGHLYQLGRG